MKERKIEILLQVLKEFTVRVSGCKHWLDESMTDICKEEGASLKQVFYAFLCCLLYRHGLSKHKFCVVIKKKILEFLTLEFSGCSTGKT